MALTFVSQTSRNFPHPELSFNIILSLISCSQTVAVVYKVFLEYDCCL